LRSYLLTSLAVQINCDPWPPLEVAWENWDHFSSKWIYTFFSINTLDSSLNTHNFMIILSSYFILKHFFLKLFSHFPQNHENWNIQRTEFSLQKRVLFSRETNCIRHQKFIFPERKIKILVKTKLFLKKLPQLFTVWGADCRKTRIESLPKKNDFR